MSRILWILPVLLLPVLLISVPCFAGDDEGGSADTKLPEGVSAFRYGTQSLKVKHDIPLEKVRRGIPGRDPRDAIPAILKPTFQAASTLPEKGAERRAIVLQVGKDVRAYPLYILDRHELVNDVVGGKPVLITWCPLCGSGVVYGREVKGHRLTFGVSGYLYQSDVLMYDHQTESFWSQLRLKAVLGPFTGTALKVQSSRVMTLAAFQKTWPEGKVLKGNLPARAYRGIAYRGYEKTARLMFQVDHRSRLLHTKAEVVGVEFGGAQRAYLLEGLRALAKPLEQEVGGTKFVLHYTKEGDEVRVRDAKGGDLPSIRLFWFAWYTFHPETELWRAKGKAPEREQGAKRKPKQGDGK